MRDSNEYDNDYHRDDFIAEEDIEEVIDMVDEFDVIDNDNELDMDNDNQSIDDIGYTHLDPEYEIDCQQETFHAHNGSTFCITVPKANSTNFAQCIFTGGEDDRACVWDAITFTLIHQIMHNDSVVSVDFNNTCEYALSADMSGIVNIFKYPYWTPIEFSLETSDIEWCVFHPNLSRVVIAGLKNWQLQIWELPTCQYRLLIPNSTYPDDHVDIISAPQIEFFNQNHTLLLAGYGDGSIYLWNIKSGSVINKFTHRYGFSSAITCMSIFQNDQIFVAGSDSTPLIKMYDALKGEYLLELNHYKICQKSSIEAIQICQRSEFILSATIVENTPEFDQIGGQLCIWNTNPGSFYNIINFKDGITKMRLFTFNPHWTLIGLLNGSIGVVNFFNCEIISFLNPHTGSILSLSFKEDENMILSASDDGGIMCLRVGNSSHEELDSIVNSI